MFVFRIKVWLVVYWIYRFGIFSIVIGVIDWVILVFDFVRVCVDYCVGWFVFIWLCLDSIKFLLGLIKSGVDCGGFVLSLNVKNRLRCFWKIVKWILVLCLVVVDGRVG